ncbi:hypothetical protein WAK64_08070 [Bacillus spongiae]|uniref:KTSC domain-containing protein n=1 Tax=Bacillus spongiae TaxID=2683610 RepID=A0ABU8HCE7_9BACI
MKFERKEQCSIIFTNERDQVVYNVIDGHHPTFSELRNVDQYRLEEFFTKSLASYSASEPVFKEVFNDTNPSNRISPQLQKA